MDQLPLDRNPVPGTGPRNLTVPLAAWLRRMGFTVLEQGGTVPVGLTATWRDTEAVQYALQYLFVAGSGGTLRLNRADSGMLRRDWLVFGATVHRFREARFLLLSSQRYAVARQRALDAGTLKPAHLTTT